MVISCLLRTGLLIPDLLHLTSQFCLVYGCSSQQEIRELRCARYRNLAGESQLGTALGTSRKSLQ